MMRPLIWQFNYFYTFYSNSEECKFLINVKTSNIVYNVAYCKIWSDEKQSSLTLLKDKVNLYEFIVDHPHKRLHY